MVWFGSSVSSISKDVSDQFVSLGMDRSETGPTTAKCVHVQKGAIHLHARAKKLAPKLTPSAARLPPIRTRDWYIDSLENLADK
jgi:hypothetical protein